MSDIHVPPAGRSKTIMVSSDGETSPRLFREGEIVSGRIIGQIDARHAILRFKGQSLFVETRVPLPDRGERMFRIEATSPQVMLKLLPETPGAGLPADWLRKYLSCDVSGEQLTEVLSPLWKSGVEALPSGIRETVQSFLKLLQIFSFERLSAPASLNDLMMRSGLFFEHTLKQRIEGDLKGAVQSLPAGDLKELASRLRAQLNSMASEGAKEDALVEALGKGVDQFIHKVELFQLLNLSRPDPQERLFFFIPLWLENHAEFLELSVSLPRRGQKGEEEEGISLLFMLRLPRLGRMAIEAKVRGKNLYCLFRVAEDEAAGTLAPLFSELETRLSHLGFQSHLRVRAEPLQQGSASLVNEVGEDLNSLISIVV